MEAIFSQDNPQNRILDNSIRHKSPKRVLRFRKKFQKGSIERPYSGTSLCENIMSSPPPPPGKKIKESTTYQPTVTATTIHSLENALVLCCDNICNCLNGSMKIAASS